MHSAVRIEAEGLRDSQFEGSGKAPHASLSRHNQSSVLYLNQLVGGLIVITKLSVACESAS